MIEMIADLVERALAGDAEIIGLLVGVVFILLAAIYLLLGRRRAKGRAVLLVGLCDSGKTMLYSRLVLKQPVKSHTSMKTNIGLYKPDNAKALNIVDIPGHERIRLQNIDEHKTEARALVFLVDSLTIQKEVKDVAEYLYTLLTDEVLSYTAPPVLIACNKHDLTMAKGAKVVQSQLEKEMTTLRTTRSATLDSISQTANNNTFLGARNRDFQFSDLKPFKVRFVECSAKDGKIGKVVEFLDKVA